MAVPKCSPEGAAAFCLGQDEPQRGSADACGTLAAHRALKTGASARGLVPMRRTTSASSMPAMVVLAR